MVHRMLGHQLCSSLPSSDPTGAAGVAAGDGRGQGGSGNVSSGARRRIRGACAPIAKAASSADLRAGSRTLLGCSWKGTEPDRSSPCQPASPKPAGTRSPKLPSSRYPGPTGGTGAAGPPPLPCRPPEPAPGSEPAADPSGEGVLGLSHRSSHSFIAATCLSSHLRCPFLRVGSKGAAGARGGGKLSSGARDRGGAAGGCGGPPPKSDRSAASRAALVAPGVWNPPRLSWKVDGFHQVP